MYDEIIIDINIPINKNHGDVSNFLSNNLPIKAKITIGIVIEYPNCQANPSADQELFSFLLSFILLIAKTGTISHQSQLSL
jgi:hypothetical protein